MRGLYWYSNPPYQGTPAPCSLPSLARTLTVTDSGMHRGHDIHLLTDILATKTDVLTAQMPVLAAHTAAITAKLADVAQAKMVCDQSATSCIIAIHSAADEQMAAVDLRAIDEKTMVDLRANEEKIMVDANANRDKAAIAVCRMSLLQQVSDIPHHSTLSKCDIVLSFAKLEVGQLEEKGKAALCCEGVSNQFAMVTEVLNKIGQLVVSDLPFAPTHSGSITFQRTPAHAQAADITILGHLRDEDERAAEEKLALSVTILLPTSSLTTTDLTLMPSPLPINLTLVTTLTFRITITTHPAPLCLP